MELSGSHRLSLRALRASWKPTLPSAAQPSTISSARARSAVPAAGSSGAAASLLKSASMRRMISADSHSTWSRLDLGVGSGFRGRITSLSPGPKQAPKGD